MSVHKPVMIKEVIDILDPMPGQLFIDCTLGAGFYSQEMAQRIGSKGKLVSIEWDKKAKERFDNLLKKNSKLQIKTVLDNFANLRNIAVKEGIEKNSCSGIVFDLGLSSDQLADNERGFSFQKDAPLNMAFSQDLEGKTLDIVNNYSLKDLVKIFKEYGEDPHAHRVSRAIVFYRRKKRIARVKQLIEIIENSVPIKNLRKKKIHPATLYFQALRIATNDELNNLKQALNASLDLLKIGGKIVVVSFHSGEDRIVKNFFRSKSAKCQCLPSDLICSCLEPKLKVLTKKPLTATLEEIEENPRSRSAKLRAIEKINL
jgi:16S rRNA (cytosine1402-N4)-methyltransferase